MILILTFLLWWHPKYQLSKYADESARMLGMRTYFGRHPYFVLVDKAFPTNDAFVLLQAGKPVVLSGKQLRMPPGEQVAEVGVSLGQSFSFTMQYSIANAKASEYTLAMKSFAITDLNADGVPDMKISWEPSRRVEVWYEGQWREVQSGETIGTNPRKRLLDGTTLFFDASKGAWKPAEKGGQ